VLQVLPALKDGGVEKSTIEMALYLKKAGWIPLVTSAGGPKTAELAAESIRHIELPLTSKTPWGILWNAVRISEILRKENVTLVHARSRGPAWSAWLAAHMTGVTYVTTFHGTYGLRGGALKRFYNSVMLRGPVVIANSQFIKAHILENYDVRGKSIVVAPRGIEPKVWNPDQFTEKQRDDVRRELQVEESVPLLLMVGRITRWKGHDLVLEALGQIADLPWVLAVAGGIDKTSEYGEALQAQAERLGIANRLRWLGSRSDVPRLLSASQLAISGSTRPEAFGRVAVEAMAMGVPVVATGIGGSLETVIDGKTGWLVRPEDDEGNSEGLMFGAFKPQAMARIFRKALQNPRQLISMGKAARAHVLKTYTVDQCCAAELMAYKMVLGIAT
jgi:glycosyltransferase involved in cell wall biosynthesis